MYVLLKSCMVVRSSLVKRVLCEAWQGGRRFRVVVASSRVCPASTLLRALVALGVPATYVDITAVEHVMSTVLFITMYYFIVRETRLAKGPLRFDFSRYP